jgi:HTH-type transcriptional regulator/antitoxin HigA
MEYKLIKSEKEYKAYSKRVWELSHKKISQKIEEEIELLDLIIDKWEKEHSTVKPMDPIQLLKYLMENRNMGRDALMDILDIDKSMVSLILNYKRGLSKNVIRKLSQFFKISQEAFNRDYQLTLHNTVQHKTGKITNRSPKKKAVRHVA